MFSWGRRPTSDDRRLVFGYFHNPHVFGQNSRGFVVRDFGRQPWFFRLDHALNLDNFPAKRIGATNILAFELRVQLITLLATGTNDGDVHEWFPSKKSGRAPSFYSRE